MIYQRALFKAIRYFGSQTALAKAIGVKQHTISGWLNREHSIPYKQVLKIVDATNGYVSHHELAPTEHGLNKILDKFLKAHISSIIKLPIEKIKINDKFCFHEENSTKSSHEINQEIFQSPIYVDADLQVIGCNCQLNLHKRLEHTHVLVKIIYG